MRSAQEILAEIASRIKEYSEISPDKIASIAINELDNLREYILSEPEKQECEHVYALGNYGNPPMNICAKCGATK